MENEFWKIIETICVVYINNASISNDINLNIMIESEIAYE